MPKIVFTYGTGEKGHEPDENGATRLKNPKGIYVDESSDCGSLLVCDTNNNRCLRFPKGSQKAKRLCGDAVQVPEYDEIGQKMTRDDQLDRPYAICTTKKGEKLIVSDAHNCRLMRFESEPQEKQPRGEPLIPAPGMRVSTGAPEAIKYPRCIFPLEEDSDAEAGERLVVVDTWSHRVLLVTLGSTEPPEVLAGVPNSFGTRTDQLAYPTWAALLPAKQPEEKKQLEEPASKEDAEVSAASAMNQRRRPSGLLFVSDSANHRVMRYEPGKGEACGTIALGNMFCKPGTGSEELDTPAGLCICPKTGALIIADKNNHRLLRVKDPANATPQTAAAEVLLGPEELRYPWAVCFDKEGFLYVSDEGHHRVLKLEL